MTIIQPLASTSTTNDEGIETFSEMREIFQRRNKYCNVMYEDTSQITASLEENYEFHETEPDPMLDEMRTSINNLKNGKSPHQDTTIFQQNSSNQGGKPVFEYATNYA
jgi:hypothetical protein